MKTIRKKTTHYQCEVCRTVYDKKRDAVKCETAPVEPKLFKRGQVVNLSCSPKCVGKITMVKLIPPIEDARDRLNYGGAPDGVHVYEYYVTAICSPGTQKAKRLLYSNQLRPI